MLKLKVIGDVVGGLSQLLISPMVRILVDWVVDQGGGEGVLCAFGRRSGAGYLKAASITYEFAFVICPHHVLFTNNRQIANPGPLATAS